MHSLGSISAIASENNIFLYFPPYDPVLILWPVVADILNFRDHQMIIPGQFGFNCPSGFREEVFWNIFPIGSNVKLSPVVAAILNFISEQKNLKFVENHPMNIPG